MLSPPVSIIVVNFHSADFVLEAVRSIRERTLEVPYEIIVVDNASFDGCQERLTSDCPGVIFVQSRANIGFGGANNLGARFAKGEVLLFLNPDTELTDQAIDHLCRHFKDLNKPGAVGCRLLNSDGSLQTSCVQPMPTILNQVLDADVLQRMFPHSKIWGIKALFLDQAKATEVEVVSGACLMIRKDVFAQIGGFSPEYFMYGEDLDLCWKARNAGFMNYYVGEAIIIHHGGGSTEKSVSNFANVMMRESVFRLLRKTHGHFYATCYRVGLTAAAFVRMALLMSTVPVWVLCRRKETWDGTIRKWYALLCWGLGLEGWVRKYGSTEQSAFESSGKKGKTCAESAVN